MGEGAAEGPPLPKSAPNRAVKEVAVKKILSLVLNGDVFGPIPG